ncbi:hypothetical protein [Methylobacterium nigriterrae]|uniref:hypothetical protein n=1 Tax=Methylobacterium nigriterrae TaxID=3127512 RepID=UPI0030133682
MLTAAIFGFIAVPIVVARPEYGAYAILLVSPLIAGIARGQLGSMLRPSEVLLAFVAFCLCIRSMLQVRRGRDERSFDELDTSLLLLVATGSVAPVLWRYVRGLPLSEDDLLYAVVLIKYYALFRVFRYAVATPRQVEVCLALSVLSGVLVAAVGLLQVGNVLGVAEFLLANFDQPFEGHTDILVERATSTLATAFGLADIMVMNVVIALCLARTARWPVFPLLATLVLLGGCIAAGEFSGYLGLVVGLLAFAFVTGRFDQVLRIGIACGCVAAPLMRPVIAVRLEGFQDQELPSSWAGRWSNLTTYYFPDLFDGGNWLLGVRPSPRIAAFESWREWVYLESGYLWLLWIGGIPFLIAFGFFAAVSLRILRDIARQRTDAIGAAATSAFAYLVSMLVTMLFDPHLTLRGSADLFFPLLALSSLDRGEARDLRGFGTATATPSRQRA